jgi:UDP-3-O-[3-hydroxymyristoyl] glucosamine N-acyltransferase
VSVAFTVRELAELVGGEVVGDAGLTIQSARPLTDAAPGDITFLEDERYLVRFLACGAAVAIVGPGAHAPEGKTVIRVKEPLMAFIAVVQKLHPRPAAAFAGIHTTAAVHPTAKLAPDAAVGAYAVIGEGCVVGARARIFAGVVVGNYCTLGDDVTLYPHVVLYDSCALGNRVIIHANSVIGADGFGYRTVQGRHVKVPQLGRVEIADDVEIGACTTIDRATFGATRVGVGTKIDNLVMVGHNCQIGRHNLFVSQVGIAGSVTTGDYVVMAGQVGIADHLHIGDRSLLGAKAGVHKDVPPDQRMLGAPATPDKEQMRIMMSLEKLPEIRKDLKRIKQHLGLTDDEKDKAA